MRRIALLLTLTMLLFCFPIVALGAEDTETVSPGVTPDSYFYGLDNFIKELQLFFILDAANKAGFLHDLSEERLAEAIQMINENKAEYGVTAMKGYVAALEKAVAALDNAIISDKDIDYILEKFGDTIIGRQEIIALILKQLPEEYQVDLEEDVAGTIEKVIITVEVGTDFDETDSDETDSDFEEETDTNIDGSTDEDEEDSSSEGAEDQEEQDSVDEEPADDEDTLVPLKKLITVETISNRVDDDNIMGLFNDASLNTRQVSTVLALAELAEKEIEEVFGVLIENEMGIGATARALGLHPKDALAAIKVTFREIKNEIQAEFKIAQKGLSENDFEVDEDTQESEETEGNDIMDESQDEQDLQDQVEPEVDESQEANIEDESDSQTESIEGYNAQDADATAIKGQGKKLGHENPKAKLPPLPKGNQRGNAKGRK